MYSESIYVQDTVFFSKFLSSKVKGEYPTNFSGYMHHLICDRMTESSNLLNFCKAI